MVVLSGEALATTFVSGVVLGSLFALMAMGLTLIYSTTRILNFAHGAFFMWGAYIVWWLTAPRVTPLFGTIEPSSGLVLPILLAIPIGIAAIFVSGIATERAVIRPLRRRPNWEMTTLVATIALAIFMEKSALVSFGARAKEFERIAEGIIRFAPGVSITATEIVQFLAAIVVLLLMRFFLNHHRQGLAMRAVSQDREMSHILGVRVETVYLLTFAISVALAAVSGILLTNLLFITPEVGVIPMLKAFIIIIFGGIGSVTGTIYAAFILGQLEAFTSLLVGTAWTLPIEFAFMIIVLSIRPYGLFGYKE